jgi:hypothetical protein
MVVVFFIPQDLGFFIQGIHMLTLANLNSLISTFLIYLMLLLSLLLIGYFTMLSVATQVQYQMIE